MRGHLQLDTGFPQHARAHHQPRHHHGRGPARRGLRHLRRRQVAPGADGERLGRRPLRPVAAASAGFDRYYGFLEGETDQFSPDLVYDNHRVEPPATPERRLPPQRGPGRPRHRLHPRLGVDPPRPAVLHLPRLRGHARAPPGARPSTSPSTAGAFDEGWDVARERWFARQIEMGLLPPDTELAPRNPGVEPWDSLPENQRRLAARLQEAFAAFLEHTDDQIGRLVDDLERPRPARQHAASCCCRDNGASQEGGPFGVLHEMKYFNFWSRRPDEAVERLDDIGGPHSHANYPWGWAQAGNTPFKWYKQNTHEGGVHVPLIVHWPAGIADAGRGARPVPLRHRHRPDRLRPAGVDARPTSTGASSRSRSAGTSMRYTFDDPRCAEPQDGRSTSRWSGTGRSYHDGWKAVTRHAAGRAVRRRPLGALPRRRRPLRSATTSPLESPSSSPSSSPCWWDEAEDHGVLPLDDRGHRALRARVPRQLAPSDRPPLHLLPAADPAARPGGRGHRRAQLGPGGAHRPARGDGRCDLSPSAPRTPASASSSRTTVWCSTTTSSTTTTSSSPTSPVPVGPSVVGRPFRRDGAGGTATPLRRRGGRAATCRSPSPCTSSRASARASATTTAARSASATAGPFPFEGTLHKVDIAVVHRGDESPTCSSAAAARGHGPAVGPAPGAPVRR